MGRLRRILVGATILLATALAAAQTPLLLPEMPVNTYTTNNQRRPGVTIDALGNFVVVWSSSGQDGDSLGVFGQRFDPAGDPQGPEFQVNTSTTGSQYLASVAHDGAGNFVVVWTSDTHGGEDGAGVFGQLYDSAGDAVGGEFHVNTYTTSTQYGPRVAMSPAGNFVVVWTSIGQDGDSYGVFGQRFDSNAAAQGNEFQVNTTTTAAQYFPGVSMTDLGTFVVVWASGQNGAQNYDIFGQRFSSSATPIGGEIQISTQSGIAGQPSVATDNDGDFAVAWTQDDADGYGVFARRYDESGNAEGAPVQVNTYTTGNQSNPSVAFDATHQFIVSWQSKGQDDPADPNGLGVYAQRFGDPSTLVGSEFQLNVVTSGSQLLPAVAMNANGNFVVAWTSEGQDGSGYGIFARRGEFGAAQPMTVDAHAPGGGTQNLNGVLEPGETVEVEPGYMDTLSFDLGDAACTASDFAGPTGATYSVDDNHADYGVLTVGTTHDCFTATGDCYAMTVSSPANRPAAHWDASFLEAFFGASKIWTLHIGESFPDVPASQQFYKFVENLFHNGITGGCGGGSYCPDTSVTRAQMAVFLLKSEHGSRFVPPPCAGIFPDVACPSTFADWIEQLAAEGITGGCGGGNYCPDNPVTRQQMAVFLLKAKYGSAYVPAGCTGIFGDVPCPSQFADWIEDLANHGITGGCGGGNYCPTNPNTRGQMAVFLVKTFGLLLYGP